MKQTIRRIHLWMGVPLGLIITVICLSGAILVFEHDINRALHPRLNKVQSDGRQPLPVATLLKEAYNSRPEGTEIAGFTMPADSGTAMSVDLSKPAHSTLRMNQYSGEVLGQDGKLPFFWTVTRLHRRLFDTPRTVSGNPSLGKLVVGISTIVFVFALITGIIVWWPKNRRALAAGLKIPVSHGGYRFWFGLHDAGGIYATILLLAMALTGLTYSFKWYTSAFFAVLGEDADNIPRGSMSKLKKEHKIPDESDFAVWQKVYDELSAKYPGRTIEITSGMAKVKVRSGNHRAADEIKFDPASGKIEKVTPYGETKRIARLRGWVYSIHSGQWFGGYCVWISKILNFLAALIGASLPITGYYLWYKRSRAAK